MNDIKKLLYNQVPLNLLSYMSNHIGETFSANEIAVNSTSSKGATNQTLRLLLRMGIVSREQKGNLFLYKSNGESLILKQFKIFENVMQLTGLIEEIKPYCSEIALFGSRAEGTNNIHSDADLFIVTEYKDEVNKIMGKQAAEAIKYQAVINDPLEVASLQEHDTAFFEQVKKGITLWKGRASHGI